MRYALIIAGGSGTRLWPMSRRESPKQLIPFVGGSSLLKIACDRLDGLVDAGCRYICAGQSHRAATLDAVPGFQERCFLGEPMGRDTLNAVGLGAAVISRRDPGAVIGVFTADHVIEPVDRFREVVRRGFDLVESSLRTLVTFGIQPTFPATAYGYLKLGSPVEGGVGRVVDRFQEKPDLPTAQQYFAAGGEQYLWNSGMFVWSAATLLDCIRRYKPANHAGLMRIAQAWDSPQRDAVLAQVYPTLEKISVDYAVMEKASQDPQVRVAAVPMSLSWLDVGSWPAYAKTCRQDGSGNALAADKSLVIDSRDTLLASSDPNHLIVAVGCEGLLVVHTPDATLVCRADQAEQIKQVYDTVASKFGQGLT